MAKPSKPKPSAPKTGAVRSAAERYSWAANRTLFESAEDARFTTAESGDHASFEFNGHPYASMTLAGAELELCIKPPRALDGFRGVLPFYQRDERNWLRIRRPAIRDPRPWLEADLGSLVGSVQAELRADADADLLHSIESFGGPFLVMPSDLRARWWGAKEDAKGYQAICAGPDPAHIKEAAGAPALVLAVPDETTWVATGTGGVLVQSVSLESGDFSSVRRFAHRFPEEGWASVAPSFAVRGSLHCFDAARAGGSVGNAESLTLNLAPGDYRIDARSWLPEEGTELTLIRFARG